ncbi:proton-conducting transporter membrane subunit [Pseudonocardia sp.]|uniref:proton-conducting transporter transmembrane domain-containing protein n=1 Tax=Pseudonocardia sp. TaxID=60912 RepID=UPI003D0C10E4
MTPLGLLAPLAAAAAYAAFGWRPATRWIGTAACAVVLATAVALAVTVTGSAPVTALGGTVRVDALSAFLLLVIGAVAVLAAAATPAHFDTEIAAGRATARTAARHHVLVSLFVAAMTAAVIAADLGVVWIMIEATTICTAFLVGQRRTRASVEAAWKYVVVCSTGIALALLGTLILHVVSAHAGGNGLDLADLVALGPLLDPDATRIAVALLVLGFGTKVGLVPLHAWLPDAHSQAPAPVSALMSGVLLSVAAYAVLRVKAVSDAALGPAFLGVLLAVTALATLAVVASLLLAQRDHKRMLAYSSMEHMALVTLGAAIGTRAAVAAALLHVLGHGLAKAVLFLGAGRVLQLTGTSRIAEVRGLATRSPVLAGCLAAGLAALLGFPPFSVFASQLGIVTAGFAAGRGWEVAAALVLVLVIAAALIGHGARMLLGEADGPAADGPRAAGEGAVRTGVTTRTAVPEAPVLVTGLVACAVLGLWAGPLQPLLDAAASAAGAR